MHNRVKLEKKSMNWGIDQPTQLKQLNLNEISKPLWIEVSRKYLNSLIKDVVNNLDNKDYKTSADGDDYDLKNADNFLLVIVTKKLSRDDALKLYNNLINSNIDSLKNAKGEGKNKRNNILNVLNDIESIF